MARPIIVITPVKNEAWILEEFLRATSTFADKIIVADQGSTDASVTICSRYDKVLLIENSGTEYDESSRQNLLLQTARNIAPGDKIIMALDADEIFAANAFSKPSWETMLHAVPGTVFYFEKPLLYKTPLQCMRFRTELYPLGFVDDGSVHTAKKVHSIRIPINESAPKLFLHDLIILHYAVVRPLYQRAKCRLYSVMENIHQTKKLRDRVYWYGKRNYINYGIPVEDCPREWFEGYEKIGIDMFTVEHATFYWQDVEVLRMFKKYGCRRFWKDDIWDNEWEKLLKKEVESGNDELLGLKIARPPFYFAMLYWVLTEMVSLKRQLFK